MLLCRNGLFGRVNAISCFGISPPETRYCWNKSPLNVSNESKSDKRKSLLEKFQWTVIINDARARNGDTPLSTVTEANFEVV